MTALFKKSSSLDQRLKRVEKELSMIDDDIRTLSKCVEHPERSPEKPRLKSRKLARETESPVPESPVFEQREETVRQPPPPAHEPVPRPERAEEQDDEPTEPVEKKASPRRRAAKASSPGDQFRRDRLSEYLSGSIESVQPLRQERHVQRNKAIVMVVIVILVLFWLAYRFFFL